MIHFEKVRWKNFLSTGNQFTEIELDRNETTLIIGENVLVNLPCLMHYVLHYLENHLEQLVNLN